MGALGHALACRAREGEGEGPKEQGLLMKLRLEEARTTSVDTTFAGGRCRGRALSAANKVWGWR